MKILHQKIHQLLKGVHGINSSVTVNYTGSVLTPATTTNYTIPYTQTETITFSVVIVFRGVSGDGRVYEILDEVRDRLLGSRIVEFDPQVSGIAEVVSQYLGEVESGQYEHRLILEVKRPRTVKQKIC